MKNVKTLLILLSISTFIFASATRTDALGGAGFWADDYANIGAFPASVNNHNVAWTDGSDFTSVWNADGTTWGFAGGSGDDMANVWWGNGDMGVNFGLGMTPEDDATTTEEANTALNIGFGMPFPPLLKRARLHTRVGRPVGLVGGLLLREVPEVSRSPTAGEPCQPDTFPSYIRNSKCEILGKFI